MDIGNTQIEDLDDIKCPSCEGIVFQQGLRVKRISAIMSQTGQDEMIPLPVLVCMGCNVIHEDVQMIPTA